MEDIKKIQEFFSKPLEEGKQLDLSDFNKVVKAVEQTGHPVTVLLTPKFNEIEVLTGTDAPGDMLRDLSNAVDSLGYSRNDIIIAGDSSNLSRREYSDIFRVNGGHKDYFEESVNEMDMNDPILMKMRAAKDKLAKMRAANAGDDGNDEFFRNAKKIAFLKKEREQLMRDMEQEAEPEGGPIADEYGSKLNRIDKAIAKLQGRKEMTYDQAIAEDKSLKKGDIVKFKDGSSIYILGPKGDGYDYKDGQEKGHHPKGWFDMMISSGKAVVAEMKVGDKVTFKSGGGDMEIIDVRDMFASDLKAYRVKNADGETFEYSEDQLQLAEGESKMPTQDQVDRFFALTQNETHYLNSKPVAGQEATFNLMKVEPWDEYDLSNWNSLVRKAKSKGKSIDEGNSYARVSEPKFVKDKNNPNFLYVNFKYDLGPGGALIVFGKETMTGQIRRESAAEAMRLASDVARDLKAKYNLEDIDIVDKENGVVQVFAVSDDFINMDPNMLGENKILKQSKLSSSEYQKAKKLKDFNKDDYKWNPGESLYIKLNEASKGAMNYFSDLKFNYQKAFRYLDVEEREEYKQLAKDFFSKLQVDDKVRAVGLEESLNPEVSNAVNEATEEEENEFHKNLDKLVHKTFGHSSDEKKKSMAQELAETIKLGEGVIEEELCPKGKAYIKRRQAAGEKSSAYLSGRAVKVCKGQMSGRKKKK